MYPTIRSRVPHVTEEECERHRKKVSERVRGVSFLAEQLQREHGLRTKAALLGLKALYKAEIRELEETREDARTRYEQSPSYMAIENLLARKRKLTAIVNGTRSFLAKGNGAAKKLLSARQLLVEAEAELPSVELTLADLLHGSPTVRRRNS